MKEIPANSNFSFLEQMLGNVSYFESNEASFLASLFYSLVCKQI